ncbi:hypothetical protein TWF481_012104 [Arthrobotrys musiformis]|uniref:Uncharacterized protein n=1 Tax=Arthrobotrys musiformis TaxID=47236 RepID=A0AAV9VW17_9PEZI
MQSLIRLLPLLAAANALVPAPRLSTAGDDTRGLTAQIHIYNQWTKQLTGTGTDNQQMSVSPPASFQVATNAPPQKYSIETNGKATGQSSFKLNLKPQSGSQSTVNVELGLSPWKAGFTLDSKNPASQVGVLLAPKESSSGRDLDLLFFSGSGSFTSLVQGQIDQKLPEMLAKLKGKQITVPDKDVTLVVNDIKVAVKVSYVSLVSNPKGGYFLDAVANADVEAQLTMNSKTRGNNLKGSIKLKNVSAWINGDAKLGVSIEFFAKDLQVSIGSADVTGAIVDVIGDIYPSIIANLKTPHLFAAVANTSDRQANVDALNKLIKDIQNGAFA